MVAVGEGGAVVEEELPVRRMVPEPEILPKLMKLGLVKSMAGWVPPVLANWMNSPAALVRLPLPAAGATMETRRVPPVLLMAMVPSLVPVPVTVAVPPPLTCRMEPGRPPGGVPLVRASPGLRTARLRNMLS